MRKCFLLINTFISLFAAAQQKDESFITVNTLKSGDEEKITKAVFKYDRFQPGTLYYKEGDSIQALLNYHRYFEQVFFLNDKGDTLVLARPELFSRIVMGKDSFYFFDKGFPHQITGFAGVNLAKKEVLTLVGKEKKGLYGTYSGVASANSNQTYYDEESQNTTWLRIDENMVFKFDNRYFLTDRFHNFFPASRRNFFDLFSKKEAALKTYLKAHKVNFKKEEDLLALVSFLNKIN